MRTVAYIPSLAPEPAMSDTLSILALVVMIAVAVVLLLGLFNMMRGGSGMTSQRLMRWRVLLQAIAVLVMVAALFFARR
jgi:hypothetical protein